MVTIARALCYTGALAAVTIAVTTPSGYIASGQTSREQRAAGTATILGVVTDAGHPVPGATVSLGLPTISDVLTDDQGRFAFLDLLAGSYSIQADKPGYLGSGLGQRRPDGQDRPLPLLDGQHVTDAAIQLWRLGAISGTVLDDAGEPVVGAPVRAFGVRDGYGSIATAASLARTDDRGVYRLSRIRPGYRYFVGILTEHVSYSAPPGKPEPDASVDEAGRSAVMRGEVALRTQHGSTESVAVGATQLLLDSVLPPRMTSDGVSIYESAFAPAGAETTSGRTISMTSGADIGGVDFRLHAVPARRVTGVVLGPPPPLSRIAVRLIRAGTGAARTELETAVTFTDPKGAFVFPVVPEGSYELRVLDLPLASNTGVSYPTIEPELQTLSGRVSPWADRATWWATQPLIVGDRDIADVHVALARGARIRGRFEFTTPDAPPPGNPLIQLLRADGRRLTQISITPVALNEAKEFQSIELPPGQYQLAALVPIRKWYFERALLNGRDISLNPFDLGSTDIDGILITFSNRPTEIRGTVRSADNRPDASAAIVMMPADPRTWTNSGSRWAWRLYPELRPAVDGSYSLQGLPAGDYLIAAIPDERASGWRETDALQLIAGVATRLHLEPGSTQVLDLKTSAVR